MDTGTPPVNRKNLSRRPSEGFPSYYSWEMERLEQCQNKIFKENLVKNGQTEK
jgi:hypothetical protein